MYAAYECVKGEARELNNDIESHFEVLSQIDKEIFELKQQIKIERISKQIDKLEEETDDLDYVYDTEQAQTAPTSINANLNFGFPLSKRSHVDQMFNSNETPKNSSDEP